MTGGLFPDPLPPGLVYVPGWLSASEQRSVVDEIDSLEFSNEIARRVQHYGYRYDYSEKAVHDIGSAPPIPPVMKQIAHRLVAECYFAQTPTQVIVNEYLTDQGIAAHIDRVSFGPAVATISLLESWPMTFKKAGREDMDVLLESGSLAVMTGESRYEWTHQIRARKFDQQGAMKVSRHRRLSLTYRTVL
jgi:alkylated DNA repair dioxygenase AlkB